MGLQGRWLWVAGTFCLSVPPPIRPVQEGSSPGVPSGASQLHIPTMGILCCKSFPGQGSGPAAEGARCAAQGLQRSSLTFLTIKAH